MIDQWHISRDHTDCYHLTHSDTLIHLSGPFAEIEGEKEHAFTAIMAFGGAVEPHMVKDTFPDARLTGPGLGLVFLNDRDFAIIKLAAA